MYICKDCGSLFGAPEYTKSKKYVCPDCGSKNFTEAEYCKTCHSYFIPDGYEEYCPECVERAEEQLREAMLQKVDNDFIELLRSVYDDLDYIMGNGKDQAWRTCAGPEQPE